MLIRWRIFTITGTGFWLGVVGPIIAFVASFIAADLLWSWPLMVAMGAWGPYHWGYWYTVTHWGLLTPLAIGGAIEKRNR